MSFQTFASTPKFNTPIGVVLDHKIFQNSSYNREVAQDIKEIYRMLRKGKVNLKLVNNTLSKVKKVPAFSFAQRWLINIKNIEGTDKIDEIVSNCLASRKLASEPLGEVWVKSVERFCFYKVKYLKEEINDEGIFNVYLKLEPFFKRRNVFLTVLEDKTDNPKIKKIIQILKEKRSEDYYNSLLARRMIQVQRLKINRDEYTKEDFNKFYTWYKELPKKVLIRKSIQDKTVQMATSLDRHGFDQAAQKILTFINSKFYNEDALYAHLWSYVKNENYSEALDKVINKFQVKNESKINSTQLRFWIGKTYFKVSKYDKATAFFKNIIQTEPYSFYSIVSNKLIIKMSPGFDDYLREQISFNPTKMDFDPATLSDEVKRSFTRLKAWSLLKDYTFMNAELDFLKALKAPKEVKEKVNVIAASVLTEDQNYLNSFQILYKHLSDKKDKPTLFEYNILFPRPFYKNITNLSKNKVDSTVILSLIRQESGFNPTARSHVGARGLMQLMPRTARSMRRGLASRQLYSPETNLSLGITYFSRLLKKHDGNIVYALASYNAGSHRVDRWKKTYFKNPESILHTIESIPFEETRNYVKLIYRNIFYYKLLQNPYELTSTQDLNKISDVSLGKFTH